ncbi:hypothetical protein [Hyphomonas johnsonii]|uniref:Lipoprotein n=1 Tax=Hyphomonas johnsonii MHS-2 TaxID=1280950 RepID=A0A059FCK0_9PROT|nr:hypothetical protein [Hyphomonas johnsonii]KCZ88322.1 hypothetical protein HJO_15708 [Hyphomonas johnsonii MHS-2]
MTRFALLVAVFCLFAAGGPAEAERSEKHAKVPRNLEVAPPGECESHHDALGCKSQRLKSAVERFCCRITDNPGIGDTTSFTKRVFRDRKTGELVYGVSYVTKNTSKRFETSWLIEPEWADLGMTTADVAYGRLSGSQDAYMIDTLAGKTTLIGRGNVGFALRLVVTEVPNIPYLYDKAADGTISVRMLDEANRPGAVSIDRVIADAQLPKGRASVEIMDDGSLLVHRLDANGKIFDQVFDATGATALTPPMKPLIMAAYGLNRNYMLFEIDHARRLFWPVRGADVIAKPDSLIGIRPLAGTLTSKIEPLPAAQLAQLYQPETPDPSPYAADLPICVYGRPSCDLLYKFVAVWETDDQQVAMALVSESGNKDVLGERSRVIPTFLEIATTSNAADFKSIHDLNVPDPKHHITFRSYAAVEPIVATRTDGTFEVYRYKVGGRYGLFETVTPAPEASEAAAMAWWEADLAAQRARSDKINADYQAFKDKQARDRQASLAKLAADSAARQAQARIEYDQALAAGNYALAMQTARRQLTQRDVYQTVMRSIAAGPGAGVGLADIEIARQFATAEETAVLDAHARLIDYRANVERAEAAKRNIAQNMLNAAAKYQGKPVTIPSGSQGYSSAASTANSALADAQFESRMNYLEGKTGQYMCGSSSFCD